MDEVIPTILADLRAKLHQRVEFEVKDVEDRIRHELRGSATLSTSVGTDGRKGRAEAGDAVVEVNEVEVNESVEAMAAMAAMAAGPEALEAPEAEPSKDAFKAMVQRQSSYAFAWAQGSRVQYNHKSQSLGTLMKSGSESCINRIARVANSPYFDLFWALLIVSNGAFLGIQLTVARDVNLMGIHLAYAILFAIELLLRLLALGPWAYFFAPGWSWNVLDVSWNLMGAKSFSYLFTSLHISSHLFTSLHISSHLFTSLHISSHLFTSLHISSHLFTSLHISSHLFTLEAFQDVSSLWHSLAFFGILWHSLAFFGFFSCFLLGCLLRPSLA